jgi:hypothetical protein
MITLLAASPPGVYALPSETGFGDDVPNGVAGPLGLFITVLLVIATVLLIRNMNKRLKRLPAEFPPPAPPGGRVSAKNSQVNAVPVAEGKGGPGAGAPHGEQTAP